MGSAAQLNWPRGWWIQASHCWEGQWVDPGNRRVRTALVQQPGGQVLQAKIISILQPKAGG